MPRLLRADYEFVDRGIVISSDSPDREVIEVETQSSPQVINEVYYVVEGDEDIHEVDISEGVYTVETQDNSITLEVTRSDVHISPSITSYEIEAPINLFRLESIESPVKEEVLLDVTRYDIEVPTAQFAAKTRERRVGLSSYVTKVPVMGKYITSYVEDENGDSVEVSIRVESCTIIVDSNVPLDNHTLIIKES